jgi:peptide methionine sulfoxide reductase MsrB
LHHNLPAIPDGVARFVVTPNICQLCDTSLPLVYRTTSVSTKDFAVIQLVAVEMPFVNRAEAIECGGKTAQCLASVSGTQKTYKSNVGWPSGARAPGES